MTAMVGNPRAIGSVPETRSTLPSASRVSARSTNSPDEDPCRTAVNLSSTSTSYALTTPFDRASLVTAPVAFSARTRCREPPGPQRASVTRWRSS